MKHIKLFEEFLNEGSSSLSANPTAREIAKYVWDNWKKITGLKNSERNEEGHFPDEVEDILDKYGIDYGDFSDEWAYLGESSNFINEGSSPLLREDDLPHWLYQATIKHSNYESVEEINEGSSNAALAELETLGNDTILIKNRKWNINLSKLVDLLTAAAKVKDAYYFDDNDFVKGDKTIMTIKSDSTSLGDLIDTLKNKGII